MAKTRSTRQRRAVLEELLRAEGTHPTAAELCRRLRRHLPRLGLATVYRNLERLAHASIIQRLEWSGRPCRYDGTPEPHAHVRCLRCGRLEDVPGLDAAPLLRAAKAAKQYEVTGMQLEFLGLCPRCRHRRRRGRADH